MNKLSRMLPVMVALLLVSTPAFAEDGGHAFDYLGSVGLAAGIAIGLAALGGSIGQGMAASVLFGVSLATQLPTRSSLR